MASKLSGWMRTAMAVMVIWPFLMAATAMAGLPSLTSLVAFLPLVAAAAYGVTALDPGLAVQLARDEGVRKFWQTARTVILVELSLGAYLSFVPVHAKPFLLAQLALVGAILALTQAGGIFLKAVPWVAALVAVFVTAEFFLANRNAETAPATRPTIGGSATPQPKRVTPSKVRDSVIPGATSPSSVDEKGSALRQGGVWISSGTSIPLDRGGLVSAEFQSVGGEAFVTLRIVPVRGATAVTRAVVGGERISAGSGGDALELDVVSVDWRLQRLLLRQRE